jgi:hypothetical protein
MLQLYEKTFGYPMGWTEGEQHWAWEYESGPDGPALVFVCEAEGKVVGAHANLPLRIKVGEQELIASSSFDSMVDSDYRGLGAFTSIVRAFQKSAYQRGICLSYNFPNKNSHPIHINRLGRTSIEGYVVLRRPIRRKCLLRKRGVQLLAWILKTLVQVRLQGAKMVRVDGFDERFDALWEAAKDQVKVGVVRDRRYLDWRFAQKPNVEHTTYVYQENGTIGGYVVLRKRGDERGAPGVILDVLARPNREDILLALFAQAFLHFIREQAGQVRFGAMEQGSYVQAVRHLFFYRAERHLCGQVYGDVDPAFALDGANWLISFADTDFF